MHHLRLLARGAETRIGRRLQVAALLAAVAGTLLATVPASAATLVVDRTWNGATGSTVSATFVAYTNGTGVSTIRISGMPPGRAWTPKFSTGGCSAAGSAIARLRPIVADANGAGSGVAKWSTITTSRAWSSTWSYGRFALRLYSGASVRCLTMEFVKATRVQVPGLRIDLPVVRGGSSVLCNVAMYLTLANQPQERGATFIYAHARTGMFLPLLSASRVNNGASLIGKTVYVYTSDNRRYGYQITQVRRGQRSVQGALEVTAHQLWLQTSEGPNATSTKLVVIAKRVGPSILVLHTVAAPTPHPHSCS
jgi:hypothetical protein